MSKPVKPIAPRLPTKLSGKNKAALVKTKHAYDLDLVGAERSLLRIGFFSARDTSRSDPTSVREYSVSYNSDNVRKQSTVIVSGTRGLPSSADLDKYMALIFHANNQRRWNNGFIPRVIKLSARDMLTTLRMCDSGENYASIKEWGERMVATTISARDRIWRNDEKRSLEDTVSIFQRFRVLDIEDRTSRIVWYEITLSDWLAGNLNTSFVYLTDYNTYRALTKPVSKLIFLFLHHWFQGSRGGEVNRDYIEIATILGLAVYKRESEILRSMGPALNDLVHNKVLSKWILYRSSYTTRWTLKFLIGPRLQSYVNRIIPPELGLSAGAAGLTLEGPPQAKSLTGVTTADVSSGPDNATARAQALEQLLTFGIYPTIARKFAAELDPEYIIKMLEYTTQLADSKHSKIRERRALLTHFLKDRFAPPADFLSSRERELQFQRRAHELSEREKREALECELDAEYQQAVEAALVAAYPGEMLDAKIADLLTSVFVTDPRYTRIPYPFRQDAARSILLTDMRSQFPKPILEEWLARRENAKSKARKSKKATPDDQSDLFGALPGL